MRRLIQSLVIVTYLFSGNLVFAGGGGVPVPATEFTQILNNIQLVLSRATELKMKFNQIKMIANQRQGLKAFSRSEWGEIVDVFRKMEDVLKTGKGLSYELRKMEEVFQLRHKDYKAPENYIKSYQDWSRVTLESIRSALVVSGFQRNEFSNEADVIRKVISFSDNAQWQTQAIQAGNMISNQLVQQLILLRRLSTDQMQAQGSYMAYQVNKESAAQKVAENFFTQIPYKSGKSPRF